MDMDLTADKEEEPEQKGGEDTQKRMAPPLSTRVAKKKKVSKVRTLNEDLQYNVAEQLV